MSVIEMAGMVGAGKTTLASALREDLEDRGLRVLRVETAIAEIMARSLAEPVARWLPRTARSRRALRAGYKLGVRPWQTLCFVARHPALTRIAVGAAWRSPLPLWHRRKIVRLFFRRAAAQRFFGRRLRPDEVLLLEEGLVHRAVNLFAWAPGGVDRSAVARYLALLPRTDLVVLVAAPLPVCVERARSRGLPRRLPRGDGTTVARFMHNAAEVCGGIADFLHADPRPSIVVDNGGPPDAAVASLRAAVGAHLPDAPRAARPHDAGGPAPGRAPRHTAAPEPTTPRFDGGMRLPRPTRAVLASRRPAPRIPRDVVAEVLSSFDLRAAGPVRAVSATSRADNVIVPTASGEKLVKRYKSSVPASAIAHEHSILRYLEGLGFPSPRLAVAADGATTRRRAGGWYAVFDYHPGFLHYNEHLWLPGTRERLVGLSARALSALHDALDGFVPEGVNPNGFVSRDGARVREVDWYLDRLERARAYDGRGDAAEAFRAMLDHDAGLLDKELRALDARLTSAELPRQVIHGDYGPYNLLFRRGEPIIVLDFELARIDWRVADLAKALQQFGVNRQGLQLPRIARFLADYERRRPLQGRERRLLPDVWLFLTLRRVAVCWHRFADSEDDRWLVEARRKLRLAAMITASAATLSALGGSGGTRWSQ